ncbi:hypothetical protein MT325_m192L [Paramecium bursaria chlorella virus MT325]|uniref:Uncharacterized protein m192L n=1 Tax=Paramecium bursaria Chlorella virus MT325 TaxID=346932 RepID=A7ITS2_PBCVM|nr:hypothetical protein MT325_m192L [Paramecium bursaria chlorella virus MT325]
MVPLGVFRISVPLYLMLYTAWATRGRRVITTPLLRMVVVSLSLRGRLSWAGQEFTSYFSILESGIMGAKPSPLSVSP